MAQLKTYVQGYALKVFESPKFAKLWDTLNRHSHTAVINVLTGKQTPAQKKLATAGQIAINVSPALNQVISNLDRPRHHVLRPAQDAVDQQRALHRRLEAAGLEVLRAVQHRS